MPWPIPWSTLPERLPLAKALVSRRVTAVGLALAADDEVEGVVSDMRGYSGCFQYERLVKRRTNCYQSTAIAAVGAILSLVRLRHATGAEPGGLRGVKPCTD